MKCQKCGINNVNVVIKQNINGDKTVMYLCNNCYEDVDDLKFNYSFNEMFDEFDQMFSSMLIPRVNVLIGNSNKEESFSKKHNLNSLKLDKEDATKKTNIKEDIKTIEQLELELKKAIIDEKYEDAAVIRDKIKLIKKKGA